MDWPINCVRVLKNNIRIDLNRILTNIIIFPFFLKFDIS